MWFLILVSWVAGVALLYGVVRVAAKHGYQDALRGAAAGPDGRRTVGGSDLIGAPEAKPVRPAARPGNGDASPRDF